MMMRRVPFGGGGGVGPSSSSSSSSSAQTSFQQHHQHYAFPPEFWALAARKRQRQTQYRILWKTTIGILWVIAVFFYSRKNKNNHPWEELYNNNSHQQQQQQLHEQLIPSVQQESTTTTTTITSSKAKQYPIVPDLPKGSCYYDGHCPVGTSCSVVKKNHSSTTTTTTTTTIAPPGFCEPLFRVQHEFLLKNSTTTKTTTTTLESLSLSSCLSACWNELKWDEHFYYEPTSPILLEAFEDDEMILLSSQGRPKGCAIIYQRRNESDANFTQYVQQLDTTPENNAAEHQRPHHLHSPSIQKWLETRFRYIVRVDPYDSNNNNNNDSNNNDNNRWIAYCTKPCQTNQDCITPNDDLTTTTTKTTKTTKSLQGFQCQEHVCHRNPEYWETTHDISMTLLPSPALKRPLSHPNEKKQRRRRRPRMIIVTAATGRFEYALRNLIASGKYWAPHHLFVVYNLGGMDIDLINDLQSLSNVLAVEWREGDGIPNTFPPHVHKPTVYAWKPLIINETIHKYKTSILWLDAGSSIMGPLDEIEDILHRTGLFLVKGQGIMSLSYPATYRWFQQKYNMTNSNEEVLGHKYFYSGNTQGYLYPSRYIDTIVKPNAECAMDESCIAPEGSRLENHRYDQTTLSILAYQVQAPHYTEYLAAHASQLHPNFALPSSRRIWTSRRSNSYYVDYLDKEQQQQLKVRKSKNPYWFWF